jgi:hypothetical protein
MWQLRVSGARSRNPQRFFSRANRLFLWQPGVLRLRLHHNRNVGVSVFPEREEILVRQPSP